jgi:2-polyprenyl-3-methyl-5-hydroxy-6-metoxy-1,4-benzoquinol methylase
MEEEFDTSEGTWPPPKNMARLKRSTSKTLKRAKKILNREFSEMKLLDVGCSSGAFLSVASASGVECEGVEPAENAAKAAKSVGLNVHHGYLEDCKLPDKTYDIITISEVIEHLKDPVSLFKECRRLLTTNGIIVVRTANTDSWTVKVQKGNWHYFHIDRHGGHISFFCRSSMEELAKKTGFQIVKCCTRSLSFCDKDSISFVKYRFCKFFSEILYLPAKITGNGHEMEVYLMKDEKA